MLVCLTRGFSSQLDLWRLLTQHGLWHYPRFPISDQAVYKRLAEAGTQPLETLFAQVSQVLADRLAPYAETELAPFAAGVVALDATTLDTVARKLPTCAPSRPVIARRWEASWLASSMCAANSGSGSSIGPMAARMRRSWRGSWWANCRPGR